MLHASIVLLSSLLSPAVAQSATSTTSSAAAPIDTNNPSIVANKGNITCPEGDGIHMIVARGSLEMQGEGMTGELAANITARIPGSTSQGLVYPAVLFPYFQSEAEGVGNLTQLLYDFSAACPNAKYALLGWSQGGQVILDTLCGNSEPSFMSSAPIASQYTQSLIAVVTYGDPSFKAGLSYDRGTASRNGIFNRTNQAACNPYASRIHSYCDQNDTYCTNYNASGLAIHFGYFNKYNMDATDFVVSQYDSASSPSSGNSSTPTPTQNSSSSAGTPTSAPGVSSGAIAGPSNIGSASNTVPSMPSSTTGGAWLAVTPDLSILAGLLLSSIGITTLL